MNRIRNKRILPNHVNPVNPVQNSFSSPGFTLIELMVVVLIIGLISAVTIPNLIPLIAFSSLEGNARRLANYGRAVSAQASFTSERHVVRFDLDAEPQSYYVVHWVLPVEKEAEAAEAAAQQADPYGLDALLESGDSEGEDDPYKMLAVAFPDMARKVEGYTEKEVDLYLTNRAIDPTLLEPEDFKEVRVRMAVDSEFDGFHRSRLEARAANVLPPEDLTGEGEGIFGPEDEFDLEEVEPVEKEVEGPILRRHEMPDEVRIHSVSVEGAGSTGGVVEVEVGPLGMSQYVEIELVSEGDEWYTVIWDPTLGVTKWKAGTADE